MTLSGLATHLAPAAPYATAHMSNGSALPRGVKRRGGAGGSCAIASTARDMLLLLHAHVRYGSRGSSSGGLLGDAVRLSQQPCEANR